jgi:hypothetical protein
MFKESIEIIKNSFQEYQGTGMYMALFFISMLYIFLKEKDTIKRIFLLYFPLIVLFVTLNPLFYKAVGSVFNSYVYWRVFWMLPVGITIAYAAVLLINNINEKNQKIIVTISVFLIICASGKFIYNEENYQEVGNAYKLPDESVLVTQLIGADDEEYKKALVSETLVAYIRQVDASIELAYSRNPEGYSNNKFVSAMQLGESEKITDLAKENNCNYIVLRKDIPLTLDLNYFGYSVLDMTENYIIYKIN